MNTLLTAAALSLAAREAKPAASSAAPARRPGAAQPRARVLYADDEAQLRSLGKLVLVRSGYEVDTAADGVEAWAALNELSYNLLITDHDMPRLNGLELIAQARRAGMRLPIVMTSGSLGPMDDLADEWSDVAAFLPKPFASDTLVETVERVLRAANHLSQGHGAMISALVRITRSVQSYRHGGINE